MRLKKLNEELDKLLKQPINEISSELKQRAKDERNARYLAAQATADREKAKLDRLNRTIKATEPKEEKEVRNSLTQIAKDFCKIEDCSYSTPEIDGKDFYIVLSNIDMENGKLTKTAEEKLKELLAEMTEKYGCKYSYKVEGTKVKIICEKPVITNKYKHLTERDIEDIKIHSNDYEDYLEDPTNMFPLEYLGHLLRPWILQDHYKTNLRFAYSPTDDIGISIYTGEEGEDDGPFYVISWDPDNKYLYISKYWDSNKINQYWDSNHLKQEKLGDYWGYDEDYYTLKEEGLILCSTIVDIEIPETLQEILEFDDIMLDNIIPLLKEFESKLKK